MQHVAIERSSTTNMFTHCKWASVGGVLSSHDQSLAMPIFGIRQQADILLLGVISIVQLVYRVWFTIMVVNHSTDVASVQG
jgi:hypothetical protein